MVGKDERAIGLPTKGYRMEKDAWTDFFLVSQ